MKILCTGDVHIGRRSSRLPSLSDAHSHSAAEAWLRIVDAALTESVDLVAVTGDLIDQANRYFEAFGPLEHGLRKLADAGITTLLVAGNHDHDVLPTVVDGLRSPKVRLLGRGGSWERVTLETRSGPLHVDGWSFPQERCATSPLIDYTPAPEDGAPVIALLHADLEQPRSPYAPVSLAELRRHSSTLFLLGHVHARREVNESGGARALYPGSPQALDPGETGQHGILLLELSATGFAVKTIPISSVRYDPLEVDVSGIDRSDEVDARIAIAVRRRLEELAGADDSLRHLVCRVTLTGATTLHLELAGRLQDRAADLDAEHGSARACVESVTVATRPVRDLAAISASPGVVGVLANLILRLETDEIDPATEQLIAEASRAAREMEHAPAYLEVLERTEATEVERRVAVRGEVHRSAISLLEELLTQHEAVA